jgi:hypothetical protein
LVTLQQHREKKPPKKPTKTMLEKKKDKIFGGSVCDCDNNETKDAHMKCTMPSTQREIEKGGRGQ